MRRKTFFYYTLLLNGNYCYESVSAPLPTYPYALRFKSYQDMLYYRDAKKEFIQSTKIPVHCTVCPIVYVCDDIRVSAGDATCRKGWRKIWEYVK